MFLIISRIQFPWAIEHTCRGHLVSRVAGADLVVDIGDLLLVIVITVEDPETET